MVEKSNDYNLLGERMNLSELAEMNRKQKRDAKNSRHRRNERRREVLKILKRSPDLWRAMGEVADIANQLRNWY